MSHPHYLSKLPKTLLSLSTIILDFVNILGKVLIQFSMRKTMKDTYNRYVMLRQCKYQIPDSHIKSVSH